MSVLEPFLRSSLCHFFYVPNVLFMLSFLLSSLLLSLGLLSFVFFRAYSLLYFDRSFNSLLLFAFYHCTFLHRLVLFTHSDTYQKLCDRCFILMNIIQLTFSTSSLRITSNSVVIYTESRVLIQLMYGTYKWSCSILLGMVCPCVW